MTTSVALFVAGAKGAQFLALFLERARVSTTDVSVILCVSYRSSGLQYDPYDVIEGLCKQHSIDFCHKSQLDYEEVKNYDIAFMVGWQYLSARYDERCIVFHDSLLPKLRGFNPTVTALICGETQIGATAFRPDGGMDTGPILAQRAFDITYPVTVKDTYVRLAATYLDLALDIINDKEGFRRGGLAQSDFEATYSIWRDDEDYRIDWTMPAPVLQRFIDAVGWPYLGAKTMCGGEEIRIYGSAPLPDLLFPIRQPGKLLSIGEGGTSADVICGSGILRIHDVRTRSGTPFLFNKLRLRLG